MRSQRDELMNIYNVMMKATGEGTVWSRHCSLGDVRGDAALQS